ncbi:hypothetical protein DXG03_003214 [Asterophora parasitica]|uniref:NAD-dependent epimerase/dehydratase domain-containing protein n=1 Tax=Asterophora parasitica TaxID=117018 RepID=A0A9P7GHC3_9AGAR|nr:hypothetical protein DXG03_003214 [Asterophora parasitica]
MSELVFVTGASGFLGSHIVDQLLEKGYRVRAAARGSKVAELQESYAKFGDRLEVVGVPDIITSQFTDALNGVNAVIHSAAPLPGKAEPEIIWKARSPGAIDGTLNVVRQAQSAGITRIIVTSSIVTALNSRNSFTDKDWYLVDKNQGAEGSAQDVYRAAKTLAEQELWAFGDAHQLDITTINPPIFYGPLAQGFSQRTPNFAALSTDVILYRFLKPSSSFPWTAAYADVRDVATAHILALTGPPSSAVSRKRILLSSPHGFVVKDVSSTSTAQSSRIDSIGERPPRILPL